jgi:hypothetical protein
MQQPVETALDFLPDPESEGTDGEKVKFLSTKLIHWLLTQRYSSERLKMVTSKIADNAPDPE